MLHTVSNDTTAMITSATTSTTPRARRLRSGGLPPCLSMRWLIYPTRLRSAKLLVKRRRRRPSAMFCTLSAQSR
ncbi:hypothetical protein D9M68_486400 [compost metagenome]